MYMYVNRTLQCACPPIHIEPRSLGTIIIIQIHLSATPPPPPTSLAYIHNCEPIPIHFLSLKFGLSRDRLSHSCLFPWPMYRPLCYSKVVWCKYQSGVPVSSLLHSKNERLRTAYVQSTLAYRYAKTHENPVQPRLSRQDIFGCTHPLWLSGSDLCEKIRLRNSYVHVCGVMFCSKLHNIF